MTAKLTQDYKLLQIIAETAIVEAGGGVYKGRMGNLILFNSPTTDSTLAVPENLFTSEYVREHIKMSDQRFADAETRRQEQQTFGLYNHGTDQAQQ